MTAGDTVLLVIAAVLVAVAGFFSGADAALASMSRVRAEELVAEGRSGARRLLEITEDSPRFLNTALFLRMLCEITATVLVAQVVLSASTDQRVGVLIAVAAMLVVQFVFIGVGPRTVGRLHAQRVGLLSAGPVVFFTRVLGPLPQLLIVVGNILTPGRGFSEGPFSSEAELRELVDLAEKRQVIESGERQMIHSVFELGDTMVREVMVPRTDVVFIERTKTLRQGMSLALRSGFSRIPVIGENLDDIIGVAYLKDVTRRVFDNHLAETTERVDTVLRPVMYVPDSKPVDELLREMQAARKHVAVVVDEYGGTAGLVTIEDLLEEIVGEITDEYDTAEVAVEKLPGGAVRLSSRYLVNDLEEACGVHVEDEDVDTVGGLMAKHLGRVPIPGSVVEAHGLRFEAEGPAGRRNRIGSVLISPVEATADEDGAPPVTSGSTALAPEPGAEPAPDGVDATTPLPGGTATDTYSESRA
ncbi:MAG: Magnesium and cobalt efflux protein CorC [uncultured Nocardioidaceae bacterium]|uniref:Magnesium and cobalt efflux protein CorC n=1 Tax=uncultured Nocardioidaceae bacterium TaxID=253824 RepID=A0A6J4LSF7_9ACTN|nr:MAG: Magnesium and cobalt efflux protein CorC [uncultured Nocardioidaceae bacterium]